MCVCVCVCACLVTLGRFQVFITTKSPLNVAVVSTLRYFELTVAALCISEENLKPLLCDTNNKFSIITIAVHCVRDNCKGMGKISGMRTSRY